MTEYEKPIFTVDVVPITIHAGRLSVALVERTGDPYRGRLALPGGFIHVGEDTSAGAAARRILRDKASLTQIYVEQLSTFSGPDRDPRGWSASTAYFSVTPYDRLKSAAEAGMITLMVVEEAVGLPFDHDVIIAAAVRRVRDKGAYSDIPARLLGPEFTLPELIAAYGIALGSSVNPAAFRKKAMDRGLIQEVPGAQRRGAGTTKPAQIYRLGDSQMIYDRRF